MATILKKLPMQSDKIEFGPTANGMLMSWREFDRAEFEEGWRYELVNGVLIVSPIPKPSERDPALELAHLLCDYRDNHPNGESMSATLLEEYVKIGEQRRRADLVIWAGLGRRPRTNELPMIIAEFVSSRKRDRIRDYETKRDEYLSVGVQEYWVIDRFEKVMTVFAPNHPEPIERIFKKDQVYKTKLLPGFQLPLKRIWERADFWTKQDDA